MTKVYLTHVSSFVATHSHTGMLNEQAHTHKFLYEITLHGPLNQEGFLVDFRELQKVCVREIEIPLAQKNLNNLLEMPTTEMLAIWIYNKIKKIYPCLCKVKVAEEPFHWIEYMGEC